MDRLVTEMLHIFISNQPGDVKAASSGTPVPGYKIRIVDESGRQVSPGESGDLLVRGGSASPSYWNRAKATDGVDGGAGMRQGTATIAMKKAHAFMKADPTTC